MLADDMNRAQKALIVAKSISVTMAAHTGIAPTMGFEVPELGSKAQSKLRLAAQAAGGQSMFLAPDQKSASTRNVRDDRPRFAGGQG